MKKRFTFGNVLVLGFALFAMFFGAGNLIFPPSLGLKCGDNWGWGFLVYILVDAGLAMVALLAFFNSEGGLRSFSTKQLGKGASFVLILLNTLCLGPLVAIPRTASTTFEIAIAPLLPGVSSWIAGAVYFGLVTLLCLKPAKVVDIVGRVLSPLMLIALLILIVKGFLTPLGPIEPGVEKTEAMGMGLQSGYQTMDMLGALLLAVVTMASVKKTGVVSRAGQLKLVGLSGLLASLGLFAVYGGLAYLGATASSLYPGDLAQTELLLLITERLLGKGGTFLLGLIVAAACLTTAIGLVSSCSENLVELFGGKLSYKPVLLGIVGVSYVLSNLGTSAIIAIASPVLSVIYPVFMVLVFLSFFPDKLNQSWGPRLGALLAFVSALLPLLDSLTVWNLGSESLPLIDLGLQWVLPAVLGVLCGALIPRRPSLGKRERLT